MSENYIFPKKLAKSMINMDLRTQLEASMMAGVFMLFGVTLMIVYAIIYTEMTIFMKVMMSLNAIAGVIILGGFVVTTFQQYQALMESRKFQEELNSLDLSNKSLKGGLNK